VTLFSDGLEVAAQAFEDVTGEPITYVLKEDNIAIPVAVPETAGSSENVVAGEVRSGSRSQSWLIRAEYIVKDGVQFQPRAGHRILRGNGQLYQVQSPNGGVEWEWTDSSQTRMRVMTIEIKAS
jgi:hypothetical protein